MKTDPDLWWHSGDTFKLFVPTNGYGNDETRGTVIQREQGFSGTFSLIMNVGDTQKMNFENGQPCMSILDVADTKGSNTA
jgi:hypothetical protein